MATPRLPFLYPNLMRAVRSCEPSTYRSLQFPYAPNRRFHTSLRHEREAYQRRYGPAVERSIPPASRLKKGSSDKVPEDVPAEDESLNTSEREGASPEQLQSDPPPQDKQDAANTASSPRPNPDQQESIEEKKDDPPTDREPHEESAAAEEDSPEQDQASASSTSTSGSSSEENTESSPFSGQTPFDEVLH